VFLGAGAVVLMVSVRMTALADVIADRTGLGEAIAGGVLLGAAPSLLGLTVSATAAWSGDANLAVSNGVGGIAAQTAFLAIADLTFRKANLEHAAAEPANLFQAALLVALLTLPVLAYATPTLAVLGMHPASVVMGAGYVYGLRLSREVRDAPMWRPVRTRETRDDAPEDEDERGRPWRAQAAQFAGLAAILALAGSTISRAASAGIERFNVSSSLAGALATAVITSLPELVTTIAAVRRGALQLAVGGIIGGNTFDTMFLVASDAASRDGPLYGAMATDDVSLPATGLVMTAALTAGLIRRQREGPGGIGAQSLILLTIYAVAVGAQALLG
jgi:cation:H+ antiporter